MIVLDSKAAKHQFSAHAYNALLSGKIYHLEARIQAQMMNEILTDAAGWMRTLKPESRRIILENFQHQVETN